MTATEPLAVRHGLDSLTDAELVDMQEHLRRVGGVPIGLVRSWAALLNELTARTQARGLFDEATGQLTAAGRRALND